MNDAINGSIEFIGGLFVWMNILKLWRDRSVKGVYWPTTAFFAAWGYWNCIYYPSLRQWCSFFGGLFIAAGNTVWLALLLFIVWKRHKEGGPVHVQR